MKPLTSAVRLAFVELSDGDKAVQMQKYMKSDLPFYGVQAPFQKKIFNQTFRDFPCLTIQDWHESVLDMWREATHREEKYAAIALAGVKYYRPYQNMKSLAMFEEMIVDGAWWDYVDSICPRLGELLQDYPAEMKVQMSLWATDKNLWKRRASILCQLKLKASTDMGLLFDNIQKNVADEEFFIRKAIGWALREYGKSSADQVISFVRRNQSEMSSLSKKEALRILIKQGVIDSLDG